MSAQALPKPKKDKGLPGCTTAEVEANLVGLQQKRKQNVMDMLLEVARGDFFEKPRFTQGVRLVNAMKVYKVKQKDIAVVLGVSESWVSQCYKHYRHNPTEEQPRSGPPSPLSDVYGVIKNFIDAKNNNNEAVTMAVLLEFVNDELRIPVTSNTLRMHIQRKDFVYTYAIPRDATRERIKRADVEAYYNDIATQLNSVHPGLIFNMDEMGVEMFADRKEIKVFVPPEAVPAQGPVHVGVPRTRRRCTLVACISPDGTTMTPTIIVKTKTVSSCIYDRGFSNKNLRIFTTETSFITADIFSRWVYEVFLPSVEEKRAFLQSALRSYNDKAVLIMEAAHHTRSSLSSRSLNKGGLRCGFLSLTPHIWHSPWISEFFAGAKTS